VLLDGAGADVGACRLPELLELELELFDELEPLDELELFDELEPPDEPDLPADWCELPDDFVPADPVLAEACVEPGRRRATTPAAATLAKETVAVVAASRFRPRSRSATARVTADGRVRNCGLLMPESVSCQLVGPIRPGSEDAMSLPPEQVGQRVANRGGSCDHCWMSDAASTAALRAARDFLIRYRDDYATARREFRWPALTEFNWALDWFDVLAAEHPDRVALRVVGDDGTDESISYAAMSARSAQVANWLRGLGVRRGDRMLLMLGNVVPLWEVMLAAIKLGAVIIPASTLLAPADLADRIERGQVRHVVTDTDQTVKFAGIPGDWTRIAIPADGAGETVPEGWTPYSESHATQEEFFSDDVTKATDPLLLYFTSGTTSKPKLVGHTHASYPAGHLSTMYWIGIRPGDVHLNISSPGWAKHAWSNLFAPWNAGATILIVNQQRFNAAHMLKTLGDCEVNTFCAPPTVWRMLIQADLSAADTSALRECVAAGEPLNPEVIEQVRKAWGITIRDGFGQTETTAQIGNTPGQPLKPGSMGRPLPGYPVTLVDPLTGEPGPDGEICLDLKQRPLGLMTGYLGDPERDAEAMRGGYYHTGDVATVDDNGYITYVGRTDDVFKASDYRISPFELESVLIEHEAVAEAAVVPSPDPIRLAVPKAYVILAASATPSKELARDILEFCRARVAPYKRIRRIEFADLPKTVSGKIRRVELRGREADESQSKPRGTTEFWEEDL
jgi:acetyl-CoA synthetase